MIAFGAEELSSLGSFGDALTLPFDVLVLTGETTSSINAERLISAGLDAVPPADAAARIIHAQAAGYTHIAAISSMRSKDVLGRLAALLDAGMLNDVVGIESASRFVRPMVAGAVLVTVEILGSPVVLTFRPAAFQTAPTPGSPSVETIQVDAARKVTVLSTSSASGARPDLTQAKVVVSGGRPLKDAATFEELIGGVADALGGAVGATRAAVDAGIASNELQVGQTGKIVAPDLYIAAGISGSTQHMAGIKDSKVIVSINKDPEAPIFQVADFGLVADLFDAMPELKARVTR